MNCTSDLFDLSASPHAALFAGPHPWQAIHRLAGYLDERAEAQVRAEVHPSAVVEGRVTAGATTTIDALAIVRGCVWIGEGCFIGRALVRDSIIEAGAVIGNGCEVARSILLKGAKVFHNSVVLDSVLGTDVQVGGGTLLANSNLNDSSVHVAWDEQRVDTGLMKLGPMIGDGCKLGMGCLIYPGALLGKQSIVGAGVHLIGSHAPHSYIKALQTVRAVVRPSRRARRAG